MQTFSFILSLLFVSALGRAENIYSLSTQKVNWNDVNLKKDPSASREQTEGEAFCLACYQRQVNAAKTTTNADVTDIVNALNFDFLRQKGVKLGPQSVVITVSNGSYFDEQSKRELIYRLSQIPNIENKQVTLLASPEMAAAGPVSLEQIRKQVQAQVKAMNSPLVQPTANVKNQGDTYFGHGSFNYVLMVDKSGSSPGTTVEVGVSHKNRGRAQIKVEVPFSGF